MIKPLDASFIIVNYNGKRYLKRLIESINNQSNSSHETIIVDNSSTDNSTEYIGKYFPSVKLINSPNVGYGRGCNLGASKAVGEYLIFLNPDVYLVKDYLKNYINFYRIKSQQYTEPLGCFGCPNIQFDTKPKNIRTFGGGIIDIFGTPRESFNQNKIEDSFFGYGTGLFIKRQAFEKIKGFNPNIFLYGEEVDLGWRLKLYGYRHLIDNHNLFYHIGGGSKFGDNRPRQIALMTYGCFIAAFTNYHTATLLLILPIYILYLLAIIILLPIQQHFNYLYSKEIIIAFKKLFIDYQKILKFRSVVQKNRTVSDLHLFKYISPIPSVLLH